MKGLRYNLASSSPAATLVLSDTEPQPTALYVVPFGASEDYLQELGQLIEHSNPLCQDSCRVI